MLTLVPFEWLVKWAVNFQYPTRVTPRVLENHCDGLVTRPPLAAREPGARPDDKPLAGCCVFKLGQRGRVA
jgi:hypothetical protein